MTGVPRALALHGFLGSGADWEPFAPAFRDLGMVLDCPDLPGHGGVCPRGVIEDPEARFRHWSEALWRQCAGSDEPELVVGYSQGGRILLDWLARGLARPRGAVVIGSRPGFADPRERTKRLQADQVRARAISENGLEEFLVQWEKLPLFDGSERIPPPWWEAMQARRRAHDPSGIALALSALGAGAMPDLRPALSGVQVPLLVVWGEEDATYATLGAELARIVPGAATAPIPRAGHRAHLENPDAFTRILGAWWRGLTHRPTQSRGGQHP